MKKRSITVREGDSVVYEGDDRRFYDMDYKEANKPMFGMFTLKEVIQFVVFVVPIIGFIIQSNSRQASIEKAYLYLTEFSVNSDSWQSTVYGTQFKQGKPLNDAFIENMIRRTVQKNKWRD